MTKTGTKHPQYTSKADAIIGNIENIIALPCQPQPLLYLAAAGLSLIDMFAAIEDPEPKEVYHKIAGRSALCSVKKALLMDKVVAPERDSALTRYLFTGGELFDMATWYAFLAGVAESGIFEWTSNVLQFQCPDETTHSPYYGQGGPWFGGLDKDGRWQTADFQFPDGTVYAPASPSRITVKPGKNYIIGAHAEWTRAHTDTGGTVSQRIRDRTHNTIFDHVTTEYTETENRSVMGFVNGKNEYNVSIDIAVEWSGPADQSEPGTAWLLHKGTCVLFAQP